jgi:hypothetical protein
MKRLSAACISILFFASGGCGNDQDDYAESITMLSMIVMSGNWWEP